MTEESSQLSQQKSGIEIRIGTGVTGEGSLEDPHI